MIRFSIITVVYNARTLLEGTMQSVLEQTYPNIEYLVIDGGSTDGTLDIIRKYHPKLSRWVSEQDKGLYDAMNKGLHLATGDFVLFLNAGDQLYAPDTLAKIAACATAESDILYGEVMLVDDARNELGTRSELTVHQLPRQLTWQKMRFGMVVCHQGFLARRTICPDYIADNLAADIEWVIEILKKSRQTVHTQCTIATYLTGGVSKKRQQQSLKGRYTILDKHFGVVNNFFTHLVIVLRAGVFKILRWGKPQY